MNPPDPDAVAGVLQYNETTQHVIIRDAITLIQSGRVVGRAHAEYDISDVPDEHRDYVFKHLRRIKIGVLSREDLRRSDIVMDEWNRCIAEHNKLPWWKRLFTSRPLISTISDAYDQETS